MLLLLAAPFSASAATVRVTKVTYHPSTVDLIQYRAEPGEANRVTIITGSRGRYRILDDGAQLQAKADCTQLGPREAACVGDHVDAQLFDGDDVLMTENPDISAPGSFARIQVFGGDGDDLLRVIDGPGDGATTLPYMNSLYGGRGADRIEGGARSDFTEGGEGTDVILNGGGNDFIEERADDIPDDAGRYTAPEHDVLDGGGGRDHVRYSRRAGVLGRLTPPAVGGYPEEADELRGIEDLTGGSGPDELTGDDDPNQLAGEFGSDTLDGRGGADVLYDTSQHRDVMRGGAGDDRLTVAFDRDTSGYPAGTVYERDQLSCGPGRDSVASPALDTLVPADCERVRFRLGPLLGKVDPRLPLASLRDPVAVWSGARCGGIPQPRSCRAVATLRDVATGSLIGKAGQRLRAQQRLPNTPLQLSSAGRRLLSERGSMEVALHIRGLGFEDESGFRMPLLAP